MTTTTVDGSTKVPESFFSGFRALVGLPEVTDLLINYFYRYSQLSFSFLHSSGMVQMALLHYLEDDCVVQAPHLFSRQLTTTSLFTLCPMPVMRPPALSWYSKPTVKVESSLHHYHRKCFSAQKRSFLNV